MKKMRVLVMTDNMPWGHRSIAKAIYEYLVKVRTESKIDVEYREEKIGSGLGRAIDAYTVFYRYFPFTNGWQHKLMVKHDVFRKMIEQSAKMNMENLKGIVRRDNYDLIICCYFFHSHALAKLKEKERYKYKLWTVVSDPWSINPILFVPGAEKHLVYDEVGAKKAIDFGIAEDRIKMTGWWVREQAYTKYNREEVRKKLLGVGDSRPVIFVGGGSLGNNSLPKILALLLGVDKPVALVINNGTDKLAFNTVEEYRKLYEKIKKNGEIIIRNFGWIDNMPKVLEGCDMVYGKAGPNFLMEVVAKEKPFVVISHVIGQETGNLDLIRKKKLGWVKEKYWDLKEFTNDYLCRPGYYQEKYIATIKAEAEKNRGALAKVAEEIKTYQKYWLR